MAEPSGGDQAAEVRVATSVRGEQDHLRVGGQGHLGAMDEVHAELARPDVGADHAIHSVTVSQGQRPQSQGLRLFDQLFRMGGALQEGVVALAPDRGVAARGERAHSTSPCRNQARRCRS